MMQNGIDESFWDGLGVEIGPCANFSVLPYGVQMKGVIKKGWNFDNKMFFFERKLLFIKKAFFKLNMGGYLKTSRKKSRADGCGEAGGEVPPHKTSHGNFGL